jgi:hypothetical protein
MKFADNSGNAVEIRVAQYQFPELEGAEYDSNWLIIEGTCSQGGREWAFRDPSLLTNEVSRLIEWFEDRARTPNGNAEIGFIEPNLEFEWREEKLRIHFALECRPPWAPFRREQEVFFLEFAAEAEALRAAAESLSEDLKKYPIRSEFR